MPNSRAACPDYTCNPCKFDEKCPPVNFTGITSIICSYKYDVCDRLRGEHRACLKAQARMCRPVEKQVKTVCTKEVKRAWTKKCKEDEDFLRAVAPEKLKTREAEFLQSDLCRPDLLVEIEAFYELPARDETAAA